MGRAHQSRGISTTIFALVVILLVATAGVGYYVLESSMSVGPTTSAHPSESGTASTSQTLASTSTSLPTSSSSTYSKTSSTQAFTSSSSTSTLQTSSSTVLVTSSSSSSSSSSSTQATSTGPPLVAPTCSHVANSSATQDTILGYSYNPPSIRVVIGVNNTITWTNQDPDPHTVTSTQLGLFNSASIAPGKSFTCTFISSGTYSYYCVIHPYMQGTVVVEQKP